MSQHNLEFIIYSLCYTQPNQIYYLFIERQQIMSVPIYRYHASQSDGWRFHFSTNPMLGQGWIFDGVAFYVPDNTVSYAIPLYQFHYNQSKSYGGTRFNFNTTMKPAKQGWVCDGISFKVFGSQIDNTVPIYQYHCLQKDGYRFHFSYGEKPAQQGWIKDKIAFYAYPGQVQ